MCLFQRFKRDLSVLTCAQICQETKVFNQSFSMNLDISSKDISSNSSKLSEIFYPHCFFYLYICTVQIYNRCVSINFIPPMKLQRHLMPKNWDFHSLSQSTLEQLSNKISLLPLECTEFLHLCQMEDETFVFTDRVRMLI